MRCDMYMNVAQCTLTGQVCTCLWLECVCGSSCSKYAASPDTADICSICLCALQCVNCFQQSCAQVCMSSPCTCLQNRFAMPRKVNKLWCFIDSHVTRSSCVRVCARARSCMLVRMCMCAPYTMFAHRSESVNGKQKTLLLSQTPFQPISMLL